MRLFSSSVDLRLLIHGNVTFVQPGTICHGWNTTWSWSALQIASKSPAGAVVFAQPGSFSLLPLTLPIPLWVLFICFTLADSFLLSFLLFFYSFFPLVFAYLFEDRVTICSPGWFRIHYVNQAGPNLQKSACFCTILGLQFPHLSL